MTTAHTRLPFSEWSDNKFVSWISDVETACASVVFRGQQDRMAEIFEYLQEKEITLKCLIGRLGGHLGTTLPMETDGERSATARIARDGERNSKNNVYSKHPKLALPVQNTSTATSGPLRRIVCSPLNFADGKKTFEEMNLEKELLTNLCRNGFRNPTEFQRSAIPLLLKGHNIAAQVPHGTGAMTAFLITVLQNIDVKALHYQALIVTSDKRIQPIQKAVMALADHMDIQCRICTTGDRQVGHVLIGTPGNIVNSSYQNTLKLKSIKILVMDEMDEIPVRRYRHVQHIFGSTPAGAQVAVISRSKYRSPDAMVNEFSKYIPSPIRLSIDQDDVPLKDVRQFYLAVPCNKNDAKFELLKNLHLTLKMTQCIIFCNTKETLDSVAEQMGKLGFVVLTMYEGMRRTRKEIMQRFRSGPVQILITTETLESMGDHQANLIINYDLPDLCENYFSRIGSRSEAKLCIVTLETTLADESYRRWAVEQYYNTTIDRLEKLPCVPLLDRKESSFCW